MNVVDCWITAHSHILEKQEPKQDIGFRYSDILDVERVLDGGPKFSPERHLQEMTVGLYKAVHQLGLLDIQKF